MKATSICFLMILLSNFISAESPHVNKNKSHLILPLFRHKCDIIWHNVYDYCIQRGFSNNEASQIACSAETACNKKR